MNLHFQGVWQNAHKSMKLLILAFVWQMSMKFIRQLANCQALLLVLSKGRCCY